MNVKTSVLNLGQFPPDRFISLVRLQEECGYEALWYADERFFREVYAGLTLAAVNTQRISLGTMVTDPYVRHPAVTAMGIATLDELSNGRAMLGVGAGVSGFAEMKVERRKPAQAMREMVAVFRGLLGGDVVDLHGQVIEFDHGRLDFRPIRADVPVYIASNGPLGLALAGEIADGAVMQSAVADKLIDWMLQHVSKGATRVGRDLSDVDVVARVNVCIHVDPKVAKDLMRPSIVRTLVAQQPEFRTFKTAGLEIPDKLRQAVTSLGYTHDPEILAPVAAMIPDEFVDAITLAGTVDQVSTQVIRMIRLGVTHVMIYPMTPDGNVEDVITDFAQKVMPAVRQTVGSDA
ncbi:MAG: LLM class flavin-dependent oxidoreductase [Anaerolineae bacterium]|jgi:5,10-methylenetetrahydromethanopterin reductase